MTHAIAHVAKYYAYWESECNREAKRLGYDSVFYWPLRHRSYYLGCCCENCIILMRGDLPDENWKDESYEEIDVAEAGG